MIRGRIIIFALLCSALLSACGQMLTTNSLPQAVNHYTCRSNLGSYALPKALMNITVTKQTGGAKRWGISVDAQSRFTADGDATFCLDFLHSPLGKNKIGVSRDANGLLAKVFTQFESQAPEVAKQVINAAANLSAFGKAQALADAAGRAGIKDTPSGSEIKTYTFDPFNQQTMNDVNRALKHRYGYCVYFDGRDDPRIPAWHNDMCPRAKTAFDGPRFSERQFAADLAKAREFSQRGILYRPEITHRLKIMRRLDPDDRLEPWKLAGTEYVQIPNRAPILALGITRGLFADAETTIEFTNGILRDVDIKKPSELNAFIDIPIFAINAVLDIPARTLTILQNDKANRLALIESNKQLIDTLKGLNDQVLIDQAIANGTLGVNSVLVPNTRSGTTGQQLTGRSVDAQCLDDELVRLDPDGVSTCHGILIGGK